MKPWIKTFSLALTLFLSLFLQACGHGGTEVGNPPGPSVPSSGAEDEATPAPTPTPGANLEFDDSGEENEIAQNPEETES